MGEIRDSTLKRIVKVLNLVEKKQLYIENIVRKLKTYDKYDVYEISKDILKKLEYIDFVLNYFLKKGGRNVKKLERTIRNVLRVFTYFYIYKNQFRKVFRIFKDKKRRGFVYAIIQSIKREYKKELINNLKNQLDENVKEAVENNLPTIYIKTLKENLDKDFYKEIVKVIGKDYYQYIYLEDSPKKFENYLYNLEGIYLKKTEFKNIYEVLGRKLYPFERLENIKYFLIDKSLVIILNSLVNLIETEKIKNIYEFFPKNGIRSIYLSKIVNNNIKINLIEPNENNIEFLKNLIDKFNTKNVNVINKNPFDIKDNLDLVIIQIPTTNSGLIAKYPEIKLFIRSRKYLSKLKEFQNKIINNLKNIDTKYLLIISNSIFPNEAEELIRNLLSKYEIINKLENYSYNGYKKYLFSNKVGRFWVNVHKTNNCFYSILKKK